MKCFESHVKLNTQCKKKCCRYWLNSCSNNNCTIVASKKGHMTLQEIGNIFGITRMRVCQIEKKIINKIKSHLSHIS